MDWGVRSTELTTQVPVNHWTGQAHLVSFSIFLSLFNDSY